MLRERDATTRVTTYVNALREAVEQEMERDPSVVLFGLDVDDHAAILGSTRGLQERFGFERVFTTPLSEDSMTGVAIGAAMAGMRPIHVHIRMDFLMLAMNQLINIAAKTYYMYGGAYKVPLVVRCIIGKSWGQGAQHSQALHAMFMHVPGLRVAIPSNAYDAKGCMIAAIRDDNPVIFVEHRLLYSTEAIVPQESFVAEIGRGRLVAPGNDITLVGISSMVLECLRARELLAEVGISAAVVDPIWLTPLDIETIAASATHTGRVLVVDNAWTSCGASAEIVARLAENNQAPQLARIGFAPTTCPTTPWLEEHFYPNPATIAAKASAMVAGGNWMPDRERARMVHQMSFRGPF
jgi:acetoin:2,6-dichlorophenolindophenol oxidoreductase subunit beta